jgi:uncharacterized membrane protein
MSTEPMGEVTSDDKLWALLIYVFSPLVPIIVLLMQDKKDRPYLKQHNIQALVLGIISVVTSGVCIGLLVWLYQVYCGIQAYSGKPVVIPVITDFVKNQGWA